MTTGTETSTQEMLEHGPEDEAEIKSFCRSLHRFALLNMDVMSERRGRTRRALRFLGQVGPNFTMMRHATTTIEQQAKRFKSPKLGEAFAAMIPGEWSLISLSLGLAMQHTRRAGYPVGGSLNLSRNIERRYQSLGGEIRYQARVTSILAKGGRAFGVRLSSGEEIDADYVVSAADGHQTLFELLPREYKVPPLLKKAYEEYPLFPSTVFVGLGVSADLSHLPHASAPYLGEPLILPGDDRHRWVNVTVYHFDPTLAPPGKTFVGVLVNSWKSQPWLDMKTKAPEDYAREKDRVGRLVIDLVESTLGVIRDQVEVCDVSTPATVVRYTGNWQGSYEGFVPTPKTLTKTLPKTIPGLRGFRMIGQWTVPGGGLPTAAKDGRDLAVALCAEHGIPFRV